MKNSLQCKTINGFMAAHKKTGINLVPKEDLNATLSGRVLKWGLSTFRIIVIVVELVVIVGFVTRFILDTRLADLDDEIESKSSVIASFSTVEQNFRQAQERLDIFSKLVSSENTTSPAIEAVVGVLPEGARLTEVSVTPSLVVVSVTSSDEREIAQFIANVQGSPAFSSVTITSVEQNRQTGLFEYRLEAQRSGV